MNPGIHTSSNADIFISFRNWNTVLDYEENPRKGGNPVHVGNENHESKTGIYIKKNKAALPGAVLENRVWLSKKKKKPPFKLFGLMVPVIAITTLIIVQGFFIVSSKELLSSSDSIEVYPVFVFFMTAIITILIWQKKKDKKDSSESRLDAF